MRLSAFPGVFLVVAAVALTGCGQPKPWDGITPEKLARLEEHRALGLAHLENSGANPGEAPLAAAEFQKIAKAQPGLAYGYLNQAVAQKKLPNAEKDALIAARRGAELAPKSGWARVIIGNVLTDSQPEEATKAFEEAVRLEPGNARVLGALAEHLRALPGDHTARTYELRKQMAAVLPGNFLAQSRWMEAQARRQEWAGALTSLESAVGSIPKLPEQSMKYYSLLKKALQTKDPASRNLATAFLNVLQDLTDSNPPLWTGALDEIAPNRGDPAYLAIREWDVPPPVALPPAPKPITVTWVDATDSTGLSDVLARGIAPVAAGDWKLAAGGGSLDSNTIRPLLAHPDLVVGASPLGLILGSSSGFTNQIRAMPAEASPLLADFNNDFTLDLYSATPQGDQVWPNPKSGKFGTKGFQFNEGAMRQPVRLPARGVGTVAAVDLDQDGDLDIARTSSQPGEPAVRWLRNNGNLTFTDLTLPSGLASPTRGARQTVFGDFDRDGDHDLFVVQAEGPSQLFLNQRQDLFKNTTRAWGVKPEAGALSAAVADYDRDGHWEIAVVGRAPHGNVLYRTHGGKLEATPIPGLDGHESEWVQWLDYDNDSWLDLAVAGKNGVQLIHNDSGTLRPAEKAFLEPARWLKSVDTDQDGDLDLLVVTADNRLRFVRNEGGNARPWIKLELEGYQGKDSPKSNNSFGIGAEVEPRTPWDRQRLLVTEPQSHIGLGRAEKAVAVRVTWTDGIPLNLIGPAARQAVHYAQIVSESCPFLYTWDGEKYRYATDFNWRSPLGMAFARGVPIPHNQTRDWVRVPSEWLKPDGQGRYHLIATEELRELSYFDQIRLMAIDHPAEVEVYADERFRLGPQPPFELFTARDRRAPVAASDGEGNDLLPALRAQDEAYTPVPNGPLRGIAKAHDLILDLGKVKDPGNVKLFLNGWIWPANTSAYVNAAQNPGIKIIPPTLYVGDGSGGWTEADRGVGLPCGKRKTLVLDLSNRFVNGDYRLKLTTTMEIRWDTAFFTSGEAAAPITRHEVPMSGADLGERGYGTPYRDSPDGPFLYDYQRPLPKGEPGWPNIVGAYTRLGPCQELLRAVDDRYVIMGPGDEIRLTFNGAGLKPLPAGWKRDFIVHTDGWTKDTDSNTNTGERVEPLPFHGMKRYPYGPDERFPDTPAHRAWKRDWNTRLKSRH